MALESLALTQEQALQAGDQLWVVTETSGPRFERLNWLSHFLLSTSLNHQMPQSSARVREILEQTGLPNYNFLQGSGVDSHLVEISRAFPAKWIILEDWSKDSIPLGTRLQNILVKAVGLQIQSIRFFLPEDSKASEVDKVLKAEWTSGRSGGRIPKDFECQIHFIESKKDSKWL